MSSLSHPLRLFLLEALMAVASVINGILKFVCAYSTYSGYKEEKEWSRTDIQRCAHRMRVLFRATPHPGCMPRLKDFLLSHVSYEDPLEAVAGSDASVSLMVIEPSVAVFAVAAKDVFSAEVGPFCYTNQHALCNQIITVPVHFFVEMAKNLPKPTAKVLMAWNTGRCGSTLVSNALGRVPRSVGVSEPDAISCLLARSLRSICQASGVKPVDVAGAAVAFVCHAAANTAKKRFQGFDPALIVLKPRNLALSALLLVSESSPFVLHAFNFRQPFASSLSRESVAKSVFGRGSPSSPSERWFRYWLKSVVGENDRLEAISDEAVDVVQSYFRQLDRSFDETTYLALYAGVFFLYYDYFHKRGVDFLLMSYDRLVLNPAEELSSWLSWLGLSPSPSLVSSCVEAMSADSQEGTVLARKALAAKRKTAFSRQEEDAMWNVFEAMGLLNVKLFRDACGTEIINPRQNKNEARSPMF